MADRQKELDEIKWAREHCLEMDNKVRALENEIKTEKDLNSSLKKSRYFISFVATFNTEGI